MNDSASLGSLVSEAASKFRKDRRLSFSRRALAAATGGGVVLVCVVCSASEGGLRDERGSIRFFATSQHNKSQN